MFNDNVHFIYCKNDQGILFGMIHVDENDVKIGEQIIGVFSVDTIKKIVKDLSSLVDESIDI